MIVNVLRKLRAVLRYGVVQRCPLCAKIRMHNPARCDLAHLKRLAFRKANHSDRLRVAYPQCRKQNDREQTSAPPAIAN